MRVVTIGLSVLVHGDCRSDWDVHGGWDSLVTDPPFGMSFKSNFRKDAHKPIENDGDDTLLRWACDLRPRHSSYVFCRWDNIYNMPKPKSLVTWVKNNWSMGDLKHEHGRQTEVILFYPGPDHYFANGRPPDVVFAPRTGNAEHPTQKPVGLMEQVVLWTAGRVFDPFMGSGSTAVACQRLGRPFLGYEIDEEHFDTACRRVWEAQNSPSLFRPRAANDNAPAQEALFT